MKLPKLMAAIAVTMGVGFGGAAKADVVYDISYSEDFVFIGNSLGDFSAQVTVDNGQVISVTGSGSVIGSITGVLPLNFQGTGNDNSFSSASPYLDQNGVAFSSSAFTELDLYWGGDSAGLLSFDDTANLQDYTFGDLAVSLAPSVAVPEPSAIAAFVGGLLGLGYLAYRRRKMV